MDHRHYVPILKSKAGEKWALAKLFSATKLRITPLIELHKHKGKEDNYHIHDLCEDLVAVWGTDDVFYIDTIFLHSTSGAPSLVEMVFSEARAVGLKAIPVARLSYSTATRAALRKVISQDKRGCLLRVGNDQASDAHAINTMLTNLKAPVDQIDFMIDYQSASMDLRTDTPSIPNLTKWRNYIAASGAFPKSYASYDKYKWHKVKRNDFLSWEDGVEKSTLLRRPTFADYTCRDPGPPAEFGAPSVNARYASNTYWLFWVGGKVKEGKSGEMPSLCADLVKRREYTGPAASAGDEAIWNTARGILGSGNATQWVQWHVNHHIEFTVQQLMSHPLL